MLDWVSGETLDELLTNAMLFVLPSDVEGLSLALLDAMGAGLCVLASDIPENRELVEGTGFTFEHGNVEDLADKLRFLIANPAVREGAGQAAKARIEAQYLWPTIAKNIEQVYLEIARGGSQILRRKSRIPEWRRPMLPSEPSAPRGSLAQRTERHISNRSRPKSSTTKDTKSHKGMIQQDFFVSFVVYEDTLSTRRMGSTPSFFITIEGSLES